MDRLTHLEATDLLILDFAHPRYRSRLASAFGVLCHALEA